MSLMERAYRVDVTVHDHDGAWSVLMWELTDPDTGNAHESPCFWTRTVGEAKRVWQQLDAGQVPGTLRASLTGRAGIVISGVQVWRRFPRPTGWGPWERHVPAIDGTREIRTGSCAPGRGDPRFDDTLRQLLGLPPSGLTDAARMALEPGQEHVA